MTKIKKFLSIIVLVLIGFIYIHLFRNTSLFKKSMEIGNYDEKIQVLEKANRLFPYNHVVYTELGRTYFEMASNDLTDTERRNANYEKAVQNFIRSIKLNPGYYQSHFYFAQTLSFSHYFLPTEIDFYDEYKKSARLTSFDTLAYFEVGRILFSRWPELSDEDKQYTLSLLKNIKMDQENLRLILQIWAINGGDYSVMDEILPMDTSALRTYAQFLAERGLSIKERQRRLADAEFMDFEKAKNVITATERAMQSGDLRQAIDRFHNSFRYFENIDFYQNLTGQNLIDISEFQEYKKSLYLNYAKGLILKAGELKGAEPYLRAYVDQEDDSAALAELEQFLNSRNLLKAEPGAYYRDVFPFYLKILIDFKLNRYRDIIENGKVLKEGFITPPDALKNDFARICQLIGESYQRIDFLYDAEDYFELALDLDPAHLDSLKGLRETYVKLNKPDKIEEIEREIDGLLTPEEISFDILTIEKGQKFTQTLFLKEKKIGLTLFFDSLLASSPPLLTIKFNDQLVWEDYLKRPVFSFSVSSKEGTNVLQVQPHFQAVTLKKIVSSTENVAIFEEENQEEKASEPAIIEGGQTREDEEEGNIQISQISTDKGAIEDQSFKVEKKKEPARTEEASENVEKKVNIEGIASLSYVNDIKYGLKQDSLEIEIHTDSLLDFKTLELSNPGRIVVDILGIDNIKSGRLFKIDDRLVEQVRIGMFKNDTARLVVYVGQTFPRYAIAKTEWGLRLTFWAEKT